MPRHELTPEERARGPRNRAKANRERREKAEELLASHIDNAIGALADALGDDKQKVAAAAQILDRALGRPTQRSEVAGTLDVNIGVVRDKLDALIEREAEAKRRAGG
jgi:hypothetical protein